MLSLLLLLLWLMLLLLLWWLRLLLVCSLWWSYLRPYDMTAPRAEYTSAYDLFALHTWSENGTEIVLLDWISCIPNRSSRKVKELAMWSCDANILMHGCHTLHDCLHPLTLAILSMLSCGNSRHVYTLDMVVLSTLWTLSILHRFDAQDKPKKATRSLWFIRCRRIEAARGGRWSWRSRKRTYPTINGKGTQRSRSPVTVTVTPLRQMWHMYKIFYITITDALRDH